MHIFTAHRLRQAEATCQELPQDPHLAQKPMHLCHLVMLSQTPYLGTGLQVEHPGLKVYPCRMLAL